MSEMWRAACLHILVSFLLVHQGQAKEKERFVERVDCISDSFTVVINKSDPEVMRMISNPKSQPVVYVYGHKTRHPCGTSMKDEKGLTNYNLTIPYGSECDVTLTDLQAHRYAETTVVLEDNADLSFGKTTRLNHVFCLYTRSVKTIRFSDVSNGQEVIASTGGKPKPKVEMLFRSTDSGKTLQAARENDYVEFFIALSPDSAYHGISPKDCSFSDREDIRAADAKKITFVKAGCPVDGIDDIIDQLANVNDQIYFSKFRTFRFGNQSTVFVHCQVQVCLKREECSKTCYKKVSDSNLTAERLRFRHKRSTESNEGRRTIRSTADGDNGSFNVTNSLTVVSQTESVELVEEAQAASAHALVPQPPSSVSASAPIPQSTHPSDQRREPCTKTSEYGYIPVIIMTALVCLLVMSTGSAIFFGCKLKNIERKDSFDMMSAYSNPTVNMPVTYSHYQRSAYNATLDSLYR